MGKSIIFASEQEILNQYNIVPKEKWGATAKDLTNQRFGRLTALFRVDKKNGAVNWVCKCDCGNYIIPKSGNLLSGNTFSCGCVGKEKSKETIKKAAEAAWKITTENLVYGQLYGPNGVRYGGPSNQKDYRGSRKDYFICPLCGNKFLSIRANVKNGHTSSCGCSHTNKTSKGEQEIIKILQKENIKFEREKRFEEAARISRCRFDFYLPEKNILLEFNGQQHYEFVKLFFNKESDFRKRQELDRLKISASLAMKIPLYCIPYWDLENLKNFGDLINPKFLVHSKFHNDEVWRAHQNLR